MPRCLAISACVVAALAAPAAAQVSSDTEKEVAAIKVPVCEPTFPQPKLPEPSAEMKSISADLEIHFRGNNVEDYLKTLHRAAGKEGLTSFDRLLLDQAYTLGYAANGQDALALEHFERIVANGCGMMSPAQYDNLVFRMGVHLVQMGRRERPDRARAHLIRGIAFMRRFLDRIPASNPYHYQTVSIAYLHLDPPDIAQIAHWQERAVGAAEARGEYPQIGEYGSLAGYYLLTDEFEKAVPLLEHVASSSEMSIHWLQLAYAYGQVGRTSDQTNVLRIAHERDMLTTTAEHLQLIDLLVADGDTVTAEVVFEEAREKKLFRDDSQLADYLAGMDVVAGGAGALFDRGSYPIVRIQPQWPYEAQLYGYSGCVEYSFTISQTGQPTDVSVLDSTNTMFERFGARAIQMFKYQPKTVGGFPVADPGQSIRLVWQLEGEKLPDHPACVDDETKKDGASRFPG